MTDTDLDELDRLRRREREWDSQHDAQQRLTKRLLDREAEVERLQDDVQRLTSNPPEVRDRRVATRPECQGCARLRERLWGVADERMRNIAALMDAKIELRKLRERMAILEALEKT